MKRARFLMAAALGAAVWVAVPAAGQVSPAAAQKLAKVDANGKLERLEGLVELHAIRKEGLPEETMKRARPLIRGWLLEVQQQVIDNVDFMTQIEPLDGSDGFFDTFDPAKSEHIQRIGAFAKQLLASGPLLSLLEFRRAIDPTKIMAIRQAAYAYDFAVLQEVLAESKDHMVQMRHQYRMGYRDVLCLYHRLLDQAAIKIDAALGALRPEKAKNLAAEVAAVKAAKDRVEARKAVRMLMLKLSVLEQRAFLNAVRDASPIEDPFSVL